MASGTQTFDQTTNSILNSMVTSFAEKRLAIELDWIAGDIAKAVGAEEWSGKSLLAWAASALGITSATDTGVAADTAAHVAGNVAQGVLSVAAGFAQISVAAAVAAANAFASTAAIPLVGPELAPAAAAAAYGETMGWAAGLGGGLASAAGGYDIPAGVNPMVMAHAQEMVLPANLANVIRGLPDQAAANGNSRADQSGGDMHFHIHSIDTQSGVQFIKDNGDAIVQMIMQKRRNFSAGLRS
jgi:hypothetical protein